MYNEIRRELSRLTEHIARVRPGTDDYDSVLKEINDLVHIENTLLGRAPESRLDTILKNPAFVGGVFSLIATAGVLYHERLEIVTSRAFGWIRFK